MTNVNYSFRLMLFWSYRLSTISISIQIYRVHSSPGFSGTRYWATCLHAAASVIKQDNLVVAVKATKVNWCITCHTGPGQIDLALASGYYPGLKGNNAMIFRVTSAGSWTQKDGTRVWRFNHSATQPSLRAESDKNYLKHSKINVKEM